MVMEPDARGRPICEALHAKDLLQSKLIRLLPASAGSPSVLDHPLLDETASGDDAAIAMCDLPASGPAMDNAEDDIDPALVPSPTTRTGYWDITI